MTPTPAELADARGAKSELRATVIAKRANRPSPERTAIGAAIADAFNAEFGARFRGATPPPIVATYLSTSTEPDTAHLNALLAELGVTTLAPVLTDDGDLDWALVTSATGATGGVPGLRGTREPIGPRLGHHHLANADVVLVPALAVDGDGHRLGRGGGSYDRALVRVRDATVVLAVVHDDEVLEAVPVEPHDRRVDGVLTPSGVQYFATAGRA